MIDYLRHGRLSVMPAHIVNGVLLTVLFVGSIIAWNTFPQRSLGEFSEGPPMSFSQWMGMVWLGLAILGIFYYGGLKWSKPPYHVPYRPSSYYKFVGPNYDELYLQEYLQLTVEQRRPIAPVLAATSYWTAACWLGATLLVQYGRYHTVFGGSSRDYWYAALAIALASLGAFTYAFIYRARAFARKTLQESGAGESLNSEVDDSPR